LPGSQGDGRDLGSRVQVEESNIVRHFSRNPKASMVPQENALFVPHWGGRFCYRVCFCDVLDATDEIEYDRVMPF